MAEPAPPGGEAGVRAAFAAQAAFCENGGSPFTAAVCRAVGAHIDRSGAIGRRVLDWPGDPSGWADGLPLRLAGGLHALVRAGAVPALAALYPPAPLPDDDTLWAAIADVLRAQADFLDAWLESPPQTNEVGRGSALIAGLNIVAAETGLPLVLFELGASAGLNLLLDRYLHELGGAIAGDPDSDLVLAPDWEGPPPPSATLRIADRQGVDINPLDPVADGPRLLAFCWPDQPRRLHALATALRIAARERPPVTRAAAADWIDAVFPAAPVPGVARVVLHSVAWQYFPPDQQARIAARIAAAGAQARPDAPVAWLRFEKEPADRETSLRLQLWPGDADRLLAWCHPHGSRIRSLIGSAPAPR